MGIQLIKKQSPSTKDSIYNRVEEKRVRKLLYKKIWKHSMFIWNLNENIENTNNKDS